MNNNLDKTYYSVLFQLLKEHPQTKELKVKGEAFTNLDLKESIEIVTAKKSFNKVNSLNSIFENLGKKKGDALSYTYKLPVNKIDLLKSSCFPNQKENAKWFEGFQKDVESITFSEPFLKNDTETLLFVLQKWTSNLASGYGEDISFYDFAKLTAATYCCLEKAEDKVNPFLFVGGGISGIQDFLYDIVSKNAAKNLKGRSFYLHVLVEAVLFKIVKKLELSIGHIVYSSGGNFYLLAPNTKSVIKDLKDLKEDISDSLFKTHQISLNSELNWIEVSASNFKGDFHFVCKRLADAVSEEKRHKFDRQILNDFESLFYPSEVGGEINRDVITNEELTHDMYDAEEVFVLGEAIPRLANEEEFKKGDNLVHLKSAYQIKLGFGLKSAKKYYPDNNDSEKIENRKGYRFPVDLGIDADFNDDEIVTYDKYKMLVNDTDNFLSQANSNSVLGFQFYGGNDYPLIKVKDKKGKEREVSKTFSEMAGRKETDKEDRRDYVESFFEPTFKRLAVLRMDVDGLGTIFREGLPSLAAYSTLSRNLDWFFKGYLNTLWKKYDENTQIIYSGGDDLFIVGRWNELIDFAKDIKEALKEFVCGNERISISGGIALVTPKFPVIKAAEYAGDNEQKAKDYSFKGIEKNAFSMMGITLNWDYEFKIVEHLKQLFVDFILNEKDEESNRKYKKPLPSSFIFKVNGFYETVEYYQERGIKDYRWIWQMAYDLTRMKERIDEKGKKEEDKPIIVFLKELIEWTIQKETPLSILKATNKQDKLKDLEFFRLLNLACIWASYEIRNKGNETNND